MKFPLFAGTSSGCLSMGFFYAQITTNRVIFPYRFLDCHFPGF
jgi:hypothetical protein